jgi:hypothetical protein
MKTEKQLEKMDINNLLNTRMVNLEPAELEYLMNNATFGEMAEYLREEHQHLRDLFAEIVFEINTMEMLNFVNKNEE